LTLRTIREIEAYEPDDNDLILANGYLSKGSRTTMLGQGGIGKSRLSLQMVLCARAGVPFIGMETRGDTLRYLMLQTENGNRRLLYDLNKMRGFFTPEQWEHIQDG